MSALDTPPILTLTEVTKVYHARQGLFGRAGDPVIALDRFSMSVQPGEIYGLVGESGSGKTTVSRLIVGLEKPDGGRIDFSGASIIGLGGTQRKAFTRAVQLIFQDPYQSLNAHFSVFDTVCEPLVIHGLGNSSERFDQGLPDPAGRRPAATGILFESLPPPAFRRPAPAGGHCPGHGPGA